MKNELKINFIRCLSSKKFKYCFLILLGFSILAYAMLFKETYGANSLILHKATDYSVVINSGNIRTIFMTFIILAPFICSLMFSDSFIEERKSNMYTVFLVRSGKNKYLTAKFITIFVVTFLSVFFILGFTEILTWISIPDIGGSGSGTELIKSAVKEEEFFLQNIYNEFPHLYNFIILGITSLFCAICSLLAFNLSLIFKINRVIMVITMFLIVNATTMILPEEYQIQMYIQTWPAQFISFVIVLSLWIITTFATFIIGLKKEII